MGIDIGGTKTHLRAIPLAGGAERDLVVPSGDWRVRNWNDDATGLVGMMSLLAEGAPIAAIGVGAHGCDDAAECLAFQSAISARTTSPVEVVNDAELMPLALDLPGQIGVVAGTGSIAVCRGPDGEMMTAGGWGWIISDDGGAGGLVRDAVRAVSRHFDRGGARGEPLVEAIIAALGLTSVPRLGTVLAQLGNATAVGALAVAVFDAAENGSELAAGVVRQGGQSLAELVGHLHRRGALATHAVAGGSVIVSQPRLWQAFVDALSASTPQITPRLFSGRPVEGACRLAVRLATSPHQAAAN
ncbi:N-acetylglucosamine kinase [Devosia sp.]|uniref:N-acetylglucosamine kinase n=1 Tax=Devosia sp. TaxID=1871048 RepID=UPI00262DE878|nr:BadF/BadG/BcrA/BcrD ATPase family protein [Devosia sp.]